MNRLTCFAQIPVHAQIDDIAGDREPYGGLKTGLRRFTQWLIWKQLQRQPIEAPLGGTVGSASPVSLLSADAPAGR